MGIHETALAGFKRGAAAYERGRPGYPSDAVDWMIDRLAIRLESAVVDLGAGTGKFTRALLRTGARVFALEPSAEMREQLRIAVPEAMLLDGTAQAIPLPDGTLDAVTAAQSFHWFATDRALAEIQRVLRDRGGLGLIWNRRDLDDPIQAALERVIAGHRGAAPAHESDRWLDLMTKTARFEPIGHRQFACRQHLDRSGLIDRVLSVSFIAVLPEPARAEVVEQVSRIAGDRRRFELPYVTDAYLYRRRM